MITTGEALSRVLINRDDRTDGPLLIFTAGIHGNETMSVQAAQNISRALNELRDPLAGGVCGFLGNLEACRRKLRCVDRDLNRLWAPWRMGAFETLSDELDTEAAEQRELYEALAPILDSAESKGRKLYFIDLHTTSAEGPPFAIGHTVEGTSAFAEALRLTLIRGLEDRISGVLSAWIASRGHISLTIEGGQHENPRSGANLEAVFWAALVYSGLIGAEQCPNTAPKIEALSSASKGLPLRMGVSYSHQIEPGDNFKMRPGFRHFQSVRKGQILAEDRRGPIYASENGRILFPLYQSCGKEGFVLAIAEN